MDPIEALQVLGVSRSQGRDVALRAYRSAIRLHPPERDPARFRRLREAWEALEALPGAWWEEEGDAAPAAAEPPAEAGAVETSEERPSGAGPDGVDRVVEDALDGLPGLDPSDDAPRRHAVEAAQAAWAVRGGPDGAAAFVAALNAWELAPYAEHTVDWGALLHANLAPELPSAQRSQLLKATIGWLQRRVVPAHRRRSLCDVSARAAEVYLLWGCVDLGVERALHGWVGDADLERLARAVQDVEAARRQAYEAAADLVAAEAPAVSSAFPRRAPEPPVPPSFPQVGAAGTGVVRLVRDTLRATTGYEVFVAAACCAVFMVTRPWACGSGHDPDALYGALHVREVCASPEVVEADCDALYNAAIAWRGGACEASLWWYRHEWVHARRGASLGLRRAIYDLLEDMVERCDEVAPLRAWRLPPEFWTALGGLCSDRGDVQACAAALAEVAAVETDR